MIKVTLRLEGKILILHLNSNNTISFIVLVLQVLVFFDTQKRNVYVQCNDRPITKSISDNSSSISSNPFPTFNSHDIPEQVSLAVRIRFGGWAFPLMPSSNSPIHTGE
jgi:hypothetical protein